MTHVSSMHPIYASLHRPILFLGVTPSVAIVEVSTLFALVFVIGLHLATVGLAALYLLVVHPAAVWMTAQDAQILPVYLRSLFTKDFYAPHASPWAPPPVVRPAMPRTR